MKTYRVKFAIEIDVRADSEDDAPKVAQRELNDHLLDYCWAMQTGSPESVVEVDEEDEL